MSCAVALLPRPAKLSVNGISTSAGLVAERQSYMGDDTRLRAGPGPREDLQELAAVIAADGARETSSSVYAALDLGTNNCRLLIAAPTADGFRVIDSFSRIIRLGE